MPVSDCTWFTSNYKKDQKVILECQVCEFNTPCLWKMAEHESCLTTIH